MKALSSNKSITVGELKEWLADARDSDTITLQISPKWGALVTAKLTGAERIGKSIMLVGFEK